MANSPLSAILLEHSDLLYTWSLGFVVFLSDIIVSNHGNVLNIAPSMSNTPAVVAYDKPVDVTPTVNVASIISFVHPSYMTLLPQNMSDLSKKAGPLKRNTRSRKPGRTRILTDTPEKRQLQIDHERRNIKPSIGKGEVTPTVARALVRKARARIQRAPDTASSEEEQWPCLIYCVPFDNSRPGEKCILYSLQEVGPPRVHYGGGQIMCMPQL